MEILFGSDNQAGISPEVFTALQECGRDIAVAYGDDLWSKKVNGLFSDIFEREAFVFSVPTGTAANALGLAAITASYGAIICHAGAHILTTEAGAPEFYAGGARLVGIDGDAGKIDADTLKTALAIHTAPSRHHRACTSLSLTQATEIGTLYSIDELCALSDIAHGHGLKVHMDGARFANAIVALDTTPAAMSWRSGVDVLSLGTTKNGTMNAEAVIVFDAVLARDLAYRQKQAGLLTSKMRFVSAQLLALFEGDLWLRNAAHANAAAADVAQLLERSAGAEMLFPVESNQMFLRLPPETTSRLESAGCTFRKWPPMGADVYRLVTSFRDGERQISQIARALGV